MTFFCMGMQISYKNISWVSIQFYSYLFPQRFEQYAYSTFFVYANILEFNEFTKLFV